ncbi:unnamed protein product [Dibothriocephalus latus]|uniref:RUN domain-containing protein n=1 Tax=Dibothriocephalus latus TaxID=60516 RepID=A0A3P7PEW6_DIBLA|nr:unnamed protein product [Dibothriocephalus latus]
MWLEILCSCEEVVTKRYHPWSFLRSPGWVQIKCELSAIKEMEIIELPRPTHWKTLDLKPGSMCALNKHVFRAAFSSNKVLSQFAFHLYPLWEIDAQLDSSSKALTTYEHKSFHKAKLPLRLLSKLHLGVRPLDPSDDCDFGAFKRDTESTGDMLVKYHLFSWEL